MRSWLKAHRPLAALSIAACVVIALLLGVWLGVCERSAGEGTIVFAADRSPAYFGDIYRVTFDGKRTNLTHSNYKETDPLLSPDGKWVAFTSERPGNKAIFVIGVDGKGLTQISPKLDPGADWYRESWSPNSKWLAVSEMNSTASKLYLLRAHHKPRLIARAHSSSSFSVDPLYPAWSPSSRLVAVAVSGGDDVSPEIRVVTPIGDPVFSVPVRQSVEYAPPTWSALGRLALRDGAKVRIFGERGQSLASFSARKFSWSPDGRRIAGIIGGLLVIRDGSDGRVIQRNRVYSKKAVIQSLKEDEYFPELLWLGNDRVGVSGIGMNLSAPGFVVKNTGYNIAVDIPSGRIRPVSERLWSASWSAWQPCDSEMALCSSPDRSQVVETARYRGGGFYLQIARLGSANARTVRKLVRVPGCWGDTGVMEAAVSNEQLSTKSKSIVYQSYCVQPYSDIYLISPDGSDLRRLTRARTFLDEPQWSPDGRKIALSRTDGVGKPGEGCPTMVWTMNANGSGLHRLTPKSDVAGCGTDNSPSWTPDGRSIVYSHSVVDGESEFRIISAAGGKPRALHVRSPYWYWGPKRIAYFDNNGNVWTANPDGSDRRRMASKAVKDSMSSSPVWSPDGRRFAWLESKEDGALTIAVLGDTLRRFPLPLNSGSSNLDWSPDGRTLAFTAARPEMPADVYTIGADGKHLRRLTNGMGASGVSWR